MMYRKFVKFVVAILFLIPRSIHILGSNHTKKHGGHHKHRHRHRSINVKVYHFMVNHWGTSREGPIDCGGEINCDWTYSDQIKILKSRYENSFSNSDGDRTVSLSLYNIHSWWEKRREHFPALCELRTNLTMVESEESKVRYHGLFDPSFKHFDGYSTTHPDAHVQRVYVDAFLNKSDLLPSNPFSTLVKGATYVASDCHKRDSVNINRDAVVQQLRNEGFRVDGLGRCMRSPTGPEGIALPNTHDSRYNLVIKRQIIAKFMFNLAFENSIEAGYVTEKPFDALMAGTVPIYLGDAAHLKALLPHPKAALFIADYNGNMTALVEYLNYLTTNETAYEEHRSWRLDFSYDRNIIDKLLLQRSWYCRVCEWAAQTAPTYHKRVRVCDKSGLPPLPDLNGKAVRGNSRTIFLVKNNTLHSIPDLDTFFALKLELEKVVSLSENEMKRLAEGTPLPPIKSGR